MRLIFDTNTLVSRLFLPGSVPAKAVSRGLHEGHILISDDTLFELAVNGRADFLISGDSDLLSMKTFRKTRILGPAEFLNV